jgi:hypothetical protein
LVRTTGYLRGEGVGDVTGHFLEAVLGQAAFGRNGFEPLAGGASGSHDILSDLIGRIG